MSFREAKVNIRSLCASIVIAHRDGFVDQVWFDHVASWMERRLTNEELEAVLLTFKEDMRAFAREKLIQFRDEYLWDSERSAHDFRALGTDHPFLTEWVCGWCGVKTVTQDGCYPADMPKSDLPCKSPID